MPRGNDAAAAAQALQDQYGVTGNAEQIIAARRVRVPRELRAANNKRINVDATANLKWDEIEKQAGVENVVDAAVRGDSVVYVYEDDEGRLHKGVLPAKLDGQNKVKVSPRDMSPEERRAHARAKAAAESLEASDEAQSAVEEAQAAAAEKAAKKIAKANADAQKEVRKTHDAERKEAKEDE